MSKYNLIIVLGGPASGKGTQCGLLVEKFKNLVHLSVGDLVRSKRDLDPGLNDLMKSGQLLPTSFIGKLIINHIMENFDISKTILLDGFPRNKENYEYYCNEMKDFFDLNSILVIDCNDDVMLTRAISRANLCGRLDDNTETCMRRIKLFHDETEEIISLFDNKLIKRVQTQDNKYDTLNEIIKVFHF